MSWACEFAQAAKDDLASLPKAIQKRVARVTTQMAADPFQGNVKALQGEEWKGFIASGSAITAPSSLLPGRTNLSAFLRILRRSRKTYR